MVYGCKIRYVYPLGPLFPSGEGLVSFHSLNASGVSVTEKDKNLEVSVPMECRDPCDTIICLEYEQEIRWEGVSGQENDVYGENP